MSQEFTNNASAILISDTLPADTTVTLAPGEGDRFPLPDAGDDDSFALLTFEDVSGNYEIVKMPSRSGDILTIERGQEGTAPAGFATGSRIELRLTAGTLANFKQVSDQYDIRGDMIDSDGVRYWHQQDPSAYQFYQIRYYDNVFGAPVLHIEPPPGITGTGIVGGGVGPDGDIRNFVMAHDGAAVIPSPGTGGPYFQIPGTLRYESLTGGILATPCYTMWDKFSAGTGTEYRLRTTAGPGVAVRYTWTCRDDQGTETWVGMLENGTMSMYSGWEVRNGQSDLYGDALDVKFVLTIDPFNPGQTDWGLFRPSLEAEDANRNLAWLFTTLRDGDPDPSNKIADTVVITEGEVQVAREPQTDNSLTNKAYVDAAIANAVSGGELDIIAGEIYGRTMLYNNAAGIGNGQSAPLTNGNYTDFHQIQVIGETKGSPNIRYAVNIDEVTITNTGASAIWAIIDKPGGGDNGGLGILFDSPTQISATGYGDDFANFRITKVIGLHPKELGV